MKAYSGVNQARLILSRVWLPTMPTISADGLTYTFTLKDGIKFGDGTPLDATMYAAQLNRLLTIGPNCPNDVADTLAVPYVKSITAPDAKTIVFTLKVPVAYFIQILATAPLCCI